jgi:glycosyltransferase involved in cell wall biosynthesis
MSSLATGGAERVTVSFLRRLQEKETETMACTVTARHDGPLAAELSEAGVIRRDLGARRLADPLAPLRLLQLLRRERVDVVHAHGQDASILGAAVRSLSGVPLIITRHVLDEPSANWRQSLRARLALAAARRADAVVAVSSAAADRLAETARLPRAAIRVIPNGIDLERFGQPQLTARRAELRRALGFGPRDQLVLLPAVLREGKGHDLLIEALPALKARVPAARVLFAGGGECETALRLQAQPHGDAIVFLGPRQDIPELLAACDLVVLPSRAEALPTALIEAAAAGRPVVATRVGGTAEVVEHGRTGWLVPPDNAATLVDAVATLLIDRERARAFGAAARRLAYEQFAIDVQVERTLALWSEVAIGARR